MNRWIQSSLVAAFMLSSLTLTAQELDQQQKPDSDPIGVYFGGFGGWIFPKNLTVTQVGTAFYSESSGGPLDVAAKGTSAGRTKGFGGLHVGYEWMNKISPG